MFKLSEKLRKLNIEQKLLFLATLIIPLLVLLAFLHSIYAMIYKSFLEYLNPPKGTIDFSCCSGGSSSPFYLSIIGFASLLTLFISSIYIFIRNFSRSTIFLIISSLIAYFLLIARYYFIELNNTLSEYLIDNIDLISFTLYLSILLIWQISAFFKYRNQNLY